MTANQNEPLKKTFTLHGASVERMVWLDTISEYDGHGRKIRRVFAGGIETRIFYDENGRPVRWEHSDGTEEICEYDGRGNEIHCKAVPGKNERAQVRAGLPPSKRGEWWRDYDENGNCIRRKNGGEEWTGGYDERGNLIYQKYCSRGKSREYWTEYDAAGRRVRARDSFGREMRYEHDANGRLVHAARSDGYEEWHEYDGRGNEIHCKAVPGKNERAQVKAGLPSSKRGEWWRDYDGNGNKIRERDADGFELWWEYEFRADGTLKRRTEYMTADEQSPQTGKNLHDATQTTGGDDELV